MPQEQAQPSMTATTSRLVGILGQLRDFLSKAGQPDDELIQVIIVAPNDKARFEIISACIEDVPVGWWVGNDACAAPLYGIDEFTLEGIRFCVRNPKLAVSL